MNCAWQAYLNILPHWMRNEVDRYGKENLLELRMRTSLPPVMHFRTGIHSFLRNADKSDIAYVINVSSQYSPWAARTLSQGYLTAEGGHRIGVCGAAKVDGEKMTGIFDPSSLCIRVARDFQGISSAATSIKGSILIIGPPGSGKTTLLRDLIREKSNLVQGSVAVIDEREEIFPRYNGQVCFDPGKHTDILSCCKKAAGITAALRSMSPTWIAVDEITEKSDCDALLEAGWCGVDLLATAHAGSINDLNTRPVYKSLIDYGLFSTVLVLQKDKSWTVERMYV